MWIEELIDIAESEASCELYGILKRPDEKYVTERAYDNPKFVEDMVRDVAARLNLEPRIAAYVVESENFESIHNHSAYALIERDKERSAGRTGFGTKELCLDTQYPRVRQSGPERSDLRRPAAAGARRRGMTLQGTINKSFLLLVVLLASALWPWSQYLPGGGSRVGRAARSRVGALAGLALALVISFKATLAPYLSLPYALSRALRSAAFRRCWRSATRASRCRRLA